MQDNGQPRPLLDPAVLERLRDALGDDDDIWRVFVQNYIEELPVRVERIRHTLTTGDLPGSIDAALSLKSSSQMVGAERLAGIGLDLELALRQPHAASDPGTALPLLAAAHLRRIKQCSKQTTYALRALL